jgi:DNA-binding transcriptional LysR family regulator
MLSSSQLVGRLRFRHLALLAALDEHRNLHRAAEAIHLTQPSATKLLRSLETTFGFALFERVPRGMQPTELGSAVIAFARRMLADLDRFADDLAIRRAGGYGRLVIGSIIGAMPDVVTRAIAEIKQRRPLLAVTLLGETSDEIVGLLLDRKIDLAIGRFLNPEQHNDVTFEALGYEALYVVARKGNPLSRLRRVELRELEQSAWILQPLSSPLRQIVEQEFGLAGMRTPSNIVECTSAFAALQLLQKSDAITMLAESVVRDHLAAGLLIRLPLAVGSSLPAFGILSRREEPLSATAAEFIQSLRKYGASARQPGGRKRRSG